MSQEPVSFLLQRKRQYELDALPGEYRDVILAEDTPVLSLQSRALTRGRSRVLGVTLWGLRL